MTSPSSSRPEFVRLHGQGRSPGHLRHDDPGAVADQVGLDVLVEVGARRHRAGVQAALVREDRVADVGLLRVRRDVDQLGDVVRHRRQPLQAFGRDRPDVELERQVGDGGRQVRVPGPLAVAVDAALHLGHPGLHGDQRVGHCAAGVVVAVDAELRARALPHVGDGLPDVVGQRATVGVAQHQRLGAGLLRRCQDRQGEVRVAAVAVEEVLRIEEDPEVVLAQEPHGVGHHGHGFVERRPQGLGNVPVPRLGHDAGDRRPGVHQVGQDGVGLRLHTGPPGRAERHQRRRGQAQLLLGPREELDVLGVRAGPAALDEGDTEVIELLGDAQLVVDGERQALLLAAVPQNGVEDVDGLGQVGNGEVVGVGAVAVRVGMAYPAVAVGVAGGVSRHDPAIPCTGPLRRGPWRSRSAGSPW